MGQITESGNNEWYTPYIYAKSAEEVMGLIELDPASCVDAQRIINAKKYYTKEDDGLKYHWSGKVWLNPPYSRGLMNKFINKLIYDDVREYIVLVNASTDTEWAHKLFKNSDMVCFTKGRIGFINKDGEKKKGNSRGQMFFYKGTNKNKFTKEFSCFGIVIDL